MRQASHILSDSPARERIHVLEVLGNAIVGGMENYVRNLVTCLPADEFKVSLLCPFESAFTTALRAKAAMSTSPLCVMTRPGGQSN